MNKSFLYIQCNLVCYIAIEKYGLADEKWYELADDIAKSFRSTELSRQDVSEESSGGRVRARARRNLFGDQSRAVQAEQSRAPLDRVGREKQGGDGLKAKSCRCSCPTCICCKMFSLILGLDAFVWLVRYIDQDHGKVGNQKGEQQMLACYWNFSGPWRPREIKWRPAEMQFFLLH